MTLEYFMNSRELFKYSLIYKNCFFLICINLTYRQTNHYFYMHLNHENIFIYINLDNKSFVLIKW